MKTAVVAFCFLLSGGSGLVFETLWTRKLTQVFDSTTLSVSSVLTAFMAGLALGSFVFGRRLADRTRRPIVWYGLLEGAIGLWGLLVPIAIEYVYPHLNRFLWDHFEPGFLSFSLLRFVFVLVLLLPPTTAMGATLPLLSRHFVRSQDEMRRVGKRVGALYSLNTLGAVAGTFAAGYVLMPAIGFAWTNRVAAMTCMCVCVLILSAFGRRETARVDAPMAPAEPIADPKSEIRNPKSEIARVRIAVMAVFGVSGFVAMNYQVAWNRVLSMVIGGSVYSFTTILLAFLVGIAIGSSVASALMRRIRNPVFWLAVVQVWIGLSSAAGYFLADEYPWLFAWLIDRLGGGRGASDATVLLIGFGVAALALLPSTIGMGAAMPLTVRVCAVGRDRIGRDVGTIYAANTVGAIAGSFLSAFVLLPALSSASFALFGAGHGLQLLIGLCVLLNLCAGTALLVAMPTRPAEGGGSDVRAQVARWVAIPFVPALGVILILATAGRGWTWDADRLVAGSFRLAYLSSILTGERRAEMLYFRDGVSTTVSVQRWGDHVAMKNNGKVDASTGDDMPTQVMVAGLPIVLHPRGPEGLRVAVIGFGSGVSVGAALGLPVARVDAVELEPAVIESSYYFREANLLEYGPPSGRRPGTPAPHPRLRVFSNDGRNFLASTSERYDVVVSEPSNPWITGVSNLFTLDHFLAARQALAPGGLFCQWVQLYEMSEESVASIMRTFASAFPHVRVFSASPQSSDVIMIGSDDPIPIDIRRLRAALARRDAAEVFAPDRTEITGVDDIVARLIMADRAELLEFAGRATINTDDNAFIEFQAPLDMIRFARRDDDVVARVYGKAWRWGRIDLRRMRETGYEPEGIDASAQVHAVSEALVRGGRAAWAADLILEAATAPSVAFAPDREQADDMLRSLRAGRDRSAARPAAPMIDALAAVTAGQPAGAVTAEIDAATAAWRTAHPRPAVAAWRLARAAARQAEAKIPPAPRFAFILEAAREAALDETMLAGAPIAPGLPGPWRPIVREVVDVEIREALAAAIDGVPPTLDGLAPLMKPARMPIGWGGLPESRPDADQHALRLLVQMALMRAERPVARPAGESPLFVARQRARYETSFEPWAGEPWRKAVPDLTLFDDAVNRSWSDPWTTGRKLWVYGGVLRARQRLLDAGDPWMEARAVPVPSAAALDEALRRARATTAATPDDRDEAHGRLVAAYAAFVAALEAADGIRAAAAWDAVTAAAREGGVAGVLDDAVPAPVAMLAIGAAHSMAGDHETAWRTLRPLLDDAGVRGGRPELAYWAARALHGAYVHGPADRVAAGDEDRPRADLLLAAQLMDRWARSGGNAGWRALLDGVATLEGAPGAPASSRPGLPAGAPPYVPLVSEGWVSDWLADSGEVERIDLDAIAAAATAGDMGKLDRALGAAIDSALARAPVAPMGRGQDARATPPPERAPITDHPEIGAFARLDGGVGSLLLLEALHGQGAGGRGQGSDAIRAIESAPRPPAGIELLRRSVAFRFLAASLRASAGDVGPMADLLGPAVGDPRSPGPPLGDLLAACPAARYHLARLVARCGPGGCELPVERRLRDALESAAASVAPPGGYSWQAGYEDPYAAAESPVFEMGAIMVRGGS